MVKMYSAELEKRAIAALCKSPSALARQALTTGLTKKHFLSDVGLEAYDRYMVMWKKKARPMTWRELTEDPGVSAKTRAALKAYKGTLPKTSKSAKSLLSSLDGYRKLRSLNAMARTISEKLQEDSIDVDSMIDEVVKGVTSLHSATVNVDILRIGGKNDSGYKALEMLLKGNFDTFLPTGFKAFDDRNHGVLWGSLLTIAGPSGQGKSAVVLGLAHNFAEQGVRTLFAGLEMSNVNNLQRRMAKVSGIPLTKLLNPKKSMTLKDKEKARLAYKRMKAKIDKVKGCIDYYSSDEDLRLETILSFAKTGGYRVVIIDYIGLLSGTDGDDQVKALGRIARQCKVWAGANNAIVVLAAQLKEDGSGVAYSSAIKQHSPNLWMFNRTPQDIELGIIRIVTPKSRMQEPMTLELRFDGAVMDVRDLTPEERRQLVKTKTAQSERTGTRKKGDKKPKSRFFSEIG